MSKKRHIKNAKHSLRKARNRIRRLGDTWYSKEWLVKERRETRERLKRFSEMV